MKSFGPPSSSINSPQLSNLPGRILTDSRIAHYCRLGYYGTERMQLQLLEDKLRKPRERRPPMSATETLDLARSLLGL